MVLSGKQKAAMLLMGLDALTAAELLKGVDPETVRSPPGNVRVDRLQPTAVSHRAFRDRNDRCAHRM